LPTTEIDINLTNPVSKILCCYLFDEYTRWAKHKHYLSMLVEDQYSIVIFMEIST